MKEALLQQAEDFVSQLFETKLSPKNFYHNIEHTCRVVEAVTQLSAKEGLNDTDAFWLKMAAWFHDTGFIEKDLGHEEVSAALAKQFLESKNVSHEDITRVEQLILATKMDKKPANALEGLIKDADCGHVASEAFFDISEKLRREEKYKKEEEITEMEWLQQNKQFMNKHRFYTDYALSKWQPIKEMNNFELDQKIKKIEDKQRNKTKNKGFGRGVDTMFRVTLKNHIELSAIADTKANILLSVNAIIISVALSGLVPKLDNESNTFLVYPTLILMIFSVASVVLSVLSTRPNISNDANFNETLTRDLIKSKQTNLLFFGNFYKMSLQDFEWGIDYLIQNEDVLYNSMTRDLYYLGLVLERKYRLLRITYTVFMIGIIISALSFVMSYHFLANIK
ncbi:Pycsar system effector family protein [Mangrovimonas xylaniphaga]|uniref:Pycsar system effector family protein n=1 Tax=Mangrovimonas xylaniphaga TaxID=1645915 RepID=UPI0006B52DA1|nr:Pycsar system effector family protein [Mangrovimonas xylaniphaga]